MHAYVTLQFSGVALGIGTPSGADRDALTAAEAPVALDVNPWIVG
jgi:hypothetical protein